MQGGKTFIHTWGGTNMIVGEGGGGYDVDGHREEEDVSEANIVVSEASKLFAGAII